METVTNIVKTDETAARIANGVARVKETAATVKETEKPVTLRDRMAARGIVKTAKRETFVNAAATMVYEYDGTTGDVAGIRITTNAAVAGMETDETTSHVAVAATSTLRDMRVCKLSKTVAAGDDNARGRRECISEVTEKVRVFTMPDAAVPDYRDGSPAWENDKKSDGNVRSRKEKGGTGTKSIFTFGSIDLIDDTGRLFRSSDIVDRVAGIAAATIAATAGIFADPIATRQYTPANVTLKKSVAEASAEVDAAAADIDKALAAGDMAAVMAANEKLKAARERLAKLSV